jgi:hypothetical protein
MRCTSHSGATSERHSINPRVQRATPEVWAHRETSGVASKTARRRRSASGAWPTLFRCS